MLAAFACKEEAPVVAPPPPAAVAVAPKAAAGSAVELWTRLPESRNACPEVYDYFPGGGMRIFWCHVSEAVPFMKLAELAGVKVFVSGPHADRLVLDSATSFGHYNPAFVKWLADHAVPSDAAAKAAIQPVYDRTMKERAAIYRSALLHLEANPDYLEAEKQVYLAYLSQPGDERPHDRHSAITPEAWPNEYPPAVAFWIRRSIDGTLPLFEEGLVKLMKAYDPQGLEALSKQDFTIAKAAPAVAGELPFPNDTLLGSIQNAWAAIEHREPDTACPHQFAYVPGGLRVQYCRAAAVLGYAALQSKLDFPIFLSGPHTKSELALERDTDFGRYNPKFVAWLADQAVPAVSGARVKALGTAGYERFLRTPARVFLWARAYVEHEDKQALLAAYAAWMKNPSAGPSPRYGYEELIPSETYEVQTIGASAIAFWLRRSMDGTDQLFAKGLEKLLSAYDPELVLAYRNTAWADLKKDGSAFEPEPEFGD